MENKRARPWSREALYSYNGLEMTVQQWARRKGISVRTLMDRINGGMTFEQAITTPMKNKRAHRGE